jgi:hypothetical protein
LRDGGSKNEKGGEKRGRHGSVALRERGVAMEVSAHRKQEQVPGAKTVSRPPRLPIAYTLTPIGISTWCSDSRSYLLTGVS